MPALAAPPDAPAVRVLVSHDDRVFSGGVARLLDDAGLDVVGRVARGQDLVSAAVLHRPDVVLVDVRAPRSSGHDSLVAAVEVRRRLPATAVLVLSTHYEPSVAPQLIGDRPEGVGYLLQHRVVSLDDVVEALTRVAAGGSVLDPEVVARLLGREVRDDPLSALSAGQLGVLAAMAEGRSNRGIAEAMHVSEAAVEKHVTALFRALDLHPSSGRHRRVQAVLVYLRAVGRR